MIYDGTMVTFRNGTTQYRVVQTGFGWNHRKFTLISVKTGRKRYNVPEEELTKWENSTPVKAVKTSLGRVARPRTWKKLPAFSGGARKTHIGDKWVFKVGHGSWGEERCCVEAARYLVQSGQATVEEIETRFGYRVARDVEYYSEVPVAECYLLEDGTLMMERVTPIRSLQAGEGAPTMAPAEREKRGFNYGGDAWPKWSSRVDSGQIGENRKGELVAYDL